MSPAKPAILAAAVLFAAASFALAGDVRMERIKKVGDKAAAFLKRTQNADGSWGGDKENSVKVALTSLQALALMESAAAAPGDPVLAKALDYIAGKQQTDGGIYAKGEGFENYNTSLAVLVLVSSADPRYKGAVEKASDFIVKNQGKDGGFSYNSKEERKGSDMSNSVMSLDALKAAGLTEKDEAFQRAVVFLRTCQNSREVNKTGFAEGEVGTDGGSIYRPAGPDVSKANDGKPIDLPDGKKGWRSYGNMTYALYLSYTYVGLSKDSKDLQATMKWIRNNYDLEQSPGIGKQGIYYYYLVFARTMQHNGEREFAEANGAKHDWAKELADKIISFQNDDGSWINKDSERWMEKNPLIATPFALRALAICRTELSKSAVETKPAPKVEPKPAPKAEKTETKFELNPAATVE
jgi:squalene-hopene/tetraprenyl-beta-curcumene cyclase